MWGMLGIVVATTAIAWAEVPGLLRRKRIKELWAFSIMLGVGFGLCLAWSFHVKLPTPTDWISFVYRPFGEAMNRWLK
ncbi:hypothetical protein [Cohnella soli]|uniref:Uncharacterized protein n=1 Tax=Cohnella soli TaxID=425005 RepID=A0ABW0HXH4_9BACL